MCVCGLCVCVCVSVCASMCASAHIPWCVCGGHRKMTSGIDPKPLVRCPVAQAISPASFQGSSWSSLSSLCRIAEIIDMPCHIEMSHDPDLRPPHCPESAPLTEPSPQP